MADTMTASAGDRLVSRDDPAPWRRREGIDFRSHVRGTGGEWVAFGQDAIGELARSETNGSDLGTRILFLAASQADRHGHCQFAADELRMSLPCLNKTTGEITYPNRTSIYPALNRLMDAGWICEDSTPRCVRFPQRILQKNYGSNTRCFQHS